MSTMTSSDFSLPLGMTTEDMITIAENQVKNPYSQVYSAIKLEITKKLAAAKIVSEADSRKRKKNRVYLSSSVNALFRYELVAQFPNWDIKFTNGNNTAAPKARAVYSLTAEYLCEKFKNSVGSVLAYGMDMRTIVMKSRGWMHMCVPSHLMSEQYEYFTQDRGILAVYNAAAKKGRQSGTSDSYVKGLQRYHCTSPKECSHQANSAVMMLHKTDTNMRQLAYYMLRHGVQLLYFAIPASKNLEFCTSGKFEELDAYVQPMADSVQIDIAYKDDFSLNHTYTHANYMELLARTECRMSGHIFRKEIDNSFLGVRVYKMTCFPSVPGIMPSSTVYKSWVDEDYKNNYLVYAPVLKTNGTSYKSSDWELVSFPVAKELVDEVHDAAMRAQGVDDLLSYIATRIASKTSNVIVLNQIIQRNNLLAVTKFDLLVLVIYSSVYMQRYADGKAVSVLAPAAREVAHNSRRGVAALALSYAGALGMKSTSSITALFAKLRKFYYDVDSNSDHPMPAFFAQPGYTEYTDTGSTNPKFKTWEVDSPVDGFAPYLPGGSTNALLMFSDDKEPAERPLQTKWEMDYWSIVSGDYTVDSARGEAPISLDEEADSSNNSRGIASFFSDLFDYSEVERMLDEEDEMKLTTSNIRRRIDKYEERQVKGRFRSKEPNVQQLVNTILNDTGNIVVPEVITTINVPFERGFKYEIVQGIYSMYPLVDLQDGLEKIFPGTSLINTMFFEGDKLYGDSSYVLKGNRIKIDLSKLMPLKPESTYLPKLGGGHTFPSAKNNMPNVLKTLEKRNANTPDNTIPMDEDKLFEDAFDAYLKVFCIPDAADRILEFQHDYIGPDKAAIEEWVTRLDNSKLTKLLSEKDFDYNSLDLASNMLMLKAKVKPNLGNSYATSVKMPQSIQYDPSGKSTAVISPVIGRKVMREQSILAPNVLILQRKSVDDVVEFVNSFDWRPDERGERFYLEGDHEQFDKHTGPRASKMHWRKCAKFGVLPAIVNLLETHNERRSVSAIEAGVKMFLHTQRGSGHPDTLDGNNDVNTLAIAELLLQIRDQIEFIIVQGDDFIVAVRGTVEGLQMWEQEVARKFNLSLKLAVHKHGYICSYDIVHLPDGHSVIVADVIKRALAFQSVSNKDEDLFHEQYISYVDNMRYVADLRVQRYLAEAIPARLKTVLPGITPEAILLIVQAHATICSNYSYYRDMFSLDTYTRHY